MAETVEIIINAKDQASGVLKGIGGGLTSLGNIAGTLAKGALVGLTAGVAALGTGLGLALGEAMDAQAGLAQLDAVLKSTGGAAGVTRDMALELADSLSAVTRFSDDSVLAAENLLLTFTNIGEDVFPRATETLLDMATAMGTDAESGAIQLGKALNDPVAGITALTRVGVTFTEEQKKAIEAMVAMGDVAGAQTIILDELAKEFGGSAEAAGQTFAGQLDILKNSLLNVAEGIGMALLPLLQNLTGFVTENVLPWVQGVGEEFTRLLEIFLATGWEDFFVTFEDGSSWVGSFFEALGLGEETAYRVGEAINNLVQFVGTNLPIAYQTVLDLWNNELYPAFLALQEWLNGDGKESFDNFMLAIQPVVDNFILLYQSFVENLPLMQEAATKFIAWFLETFGPSFENIIINLKSAFMSFVTLTAQRLEQMRLWWEAHGAQVLAVVGVAFALISTTITGALTILSGILSAVLLLWQGNWQGALDVMQTALNTFFSAVLSLTGTSTQEFQDSWEGTFELITLAFTLWTDSILLSLSTWILNFLGVWETNWNLLQTIVETVLGNVTGTFNTFKQTINSIVERVQALIDKILSIPGIPGTSSSGGGAGSATGANTGASQKVEDIVVDKPTGGTDWRAGLSATEISEIGNLMGGGYGLAYAYELVTGRALGQSAGGNTPRPRGAPQFTGGNPKFNDPTAEGGKSKGNGGLLTAGGTTVPTSGLQANAATGNIIYQLVIHSQAKTEDLVANFAMLEQLARVGA